jgi:hypothetical protein
VSQGTSCVACTCWHADTLPRTEVLCLCSCLGGFRACGARAAAEMHRPPRTPHPCRLEVAGSPSPNNMFVINGDFVDRGAWCAHLGPVQPDQLPMRRRAARPSAAAWGTQRSLGWRVCGRSQAGPGHVAARQHYGEVAWCLRREAASYGSRAPQLHRPPACGAGAWRRWCCWRRGSWRCRATCTCCGATTRAPPAPSCTASRGSWWPSTARATGG